MTSMFIAQIRMKDGRRAEIVVDDRALLDVLIGAQTDNIAEYAVLQMEKVISASDDGDECDCDVCVQKRGMRTGPRTH